MHNMHKTRIAVLCGAVIAASSLLVMSGARAQEGFNYPGQGNYYQNLNNGYACPQGSAPVVGVDGSTACVVQQYQDYYARPNPPYYPSPRQEWGYQAERRPPPPGGFTPGLGENAQARAEQLRHEGLRFQQQPLPTPRQQQEMLHPLPPGGWRP